MTTEASCYDCGRPYGNEHGFPDLVIPNDIWRQITPTEGDGGLLCPSCICKRLADSGFRNVTAAFMSGPIKSVDPDLMHALRWIENLREQGHGWNCPECGALCKRSRRCCDACREAGYSAWKASQAARNE